MPNENTVDTAVRQSSEAAQVVDKIALHLGEAAGALGAKVSQIIDQYGPNAAALIREIGRVQAVTDVGYLILFSIAFATFFTIFLKTWSKFDELIKGNGGLLPDNYREFTIGNSYQFRLFIFGVFSAASALGVLVNFKMAALYGIFSPEAYLVIKLLKW